MILLISLFLVIILFSVLEKSNSVFPSFLRCVVALLVSVALMTMVYVDALFVGIEYAYIQYFLLLVLFILILRAKNYLQVLNAIRKHKIDYSLHLLLLSIGVLGYTLLFFLQSKRWGDWDAWAIWLLHAKFLVSETTFQQMFTNQIIWSHPDYPLMWPTLVALCWKTFHSSSPLFPLLLSYGIGMLIPMVAYRYIAVFDAKRALFLFVMLTCTNLYVNYAAAQYADTLLALFILLSFVLKRYADDSDTSFVDWAFVGFFASTAG